MGDGETLQSNPNGLVLTFDRGGGPTQRLRRRPPSPERSIRALSQRTRGRGYSLLHPRRHRRAYRRPEVPVRKGYSDDQIGELLTPIRSTNNTGDHDGTLASQAAGAQSRSSSAPALEEILNTIVSNQQAILNSQATLREMVNVVVQDNFSLKDENRKLRDRMLEIERVMAEYQRREETRKERIEHRLRALEGTVAALQQQLAQLVQLYRTQGKRGGWFG